MPLFIRWGDLTDKLVGKAARGKRPFVRWPKEIASFKRAHNKCSVGVVMLFAGVPLILVSMLGVMLAAVAGSLLVGLLVSASVAVIASTGVVGFLLALVGALLYSMNPWLWRSRTAMTVSDLVESLYSEDPHLDLQSAALLTMGAMPVWLKGWAWPGRWLGTRRSGEPYTVERAGVDYLELMREIEQDPKYMWSFHGKSFPGVDYRLTGSLKNAVVEIVLLLSSLPDSGEEPDEDTVDAVMFTINRLATINGESFTLAVHQLHEEAEDKKKAAEDKRKADYNSEILRALYVANKALDAKADAETDEKYKSIQRGMKRLSKISKESGCVAESAARQLAEAASPTR